MGLSGIQIFKLLPKTNCGDCGVPTCLAFAMNLAAGKAELSACPHVSDEAKATLDAESAPPIRTVEVGEGEEKFAVGGETVLYRHEKTFFNQPGFCVLVADDEDVKQVKAKIERLNTLKYERVGLMLKANAVALKCNTDDAKKYGALVKLVADSTQMGMILMADEDVLGEVIESVKDRKPLLYAADADNYEEMADLAKDNACPLAVRGESLEEVSDLSQKLIDLGLKDLVLDPGSRSLKKQLFDHIAIRRLAINETFRPLGFPTITFPCEMTDDPMLETAYAGILVSKYAGLIVLSDIQGESLFPLLLQRLNIYTDPQRPMKTDEGIYEINGPGADSPVLVTANFSLTYFVVSGEIEASRVPTWLLVLDTDGLSVLTAWAAGKFVGDTVGALVKKCGIADKVKSKTLVLPGYAAIISGDVEEEVGSDWNVMIGPRESAHIPAFLKQNFAKAS